MDASRACHALHEVRGPQDRPGVEAVGGWPVVADRLADFGRITDSSTILAGLPTFPGAMFREVGFQTSSATKRLLVRAGPGTTPILAGRDIRQFRVPNASLRIPINALSPRDGRQLEAAVLLGRPHAIRSPPRPRVYTSATRLSVYFVFDPWTDEVMLGLLNSLVLRWFHYTSFRDAREGMPQVKIGHLRKYPAPHVASALPAVAVAEA